MMTNSSLLLDVLRKETWTAEKTLMIYSQTAKDAFQTVEVDNMAFFRSEHSIADALTRVRAHFCSTVDYIE